MSRPHAASLAEARILFGLVREEIGRHIVGHQQLLERLALIGTRYLARDHFPSPFLLLVLLREGVLKAVTTDTGECSGSGCPN